jgi:hypothetical protein
MNPRFLENALISNDEKIRARAMMAIEKQIYKVT